ncbi:MAG: anaerobic sulfatase maturase [Armatimonadota bacterium]|nr:anaerobic sulfatase maturase [Armatimonadota bacterium]
MTIPLQNRRAAPTAFHVMTKPIGPICNLDCRYCFYLEKEEMYAQEGRRAQPSWRMSDEVRETYIRQYIQQQEASEITFAWQGGEPTLLGVEFFREVLDLQQKYADGKTIHNTLQTNATLLDDEWGEFLARHKFLVGVSIDGPADLHDTYRVDKQGRPSFERVMQGIGVLQKHGVEFNTLTVVSRANAAHPRRVYQFLKEIGSTYLQFIPLVERVAPPSPGLIQLALAPPPNRGQADAEVTDWSVRADDWGSFLTTIFDDWVRRDVGRVFVQQFDVALSIWYGAGSTLCVFAPTCGKALAIEHNGDLYSCDHFVYPEYRLGNILEDSLGSMATSEAQTKFGRDKSASLPGYCRACEVRFACQGECPKHRFLRTPDGEWGLNYLCAGYRRFFNHIDAPMKAMTALLQAGRAPAEFMAEMARRDQAMRRASGRNSPCPCGSGRKAKHCCARNRP